MPESDIPHRGGHAAHEKRHRHKQHRVGPDLIRKDLKFDCPTGEYVESFSRKDRFGKSEKMYRLVSDNERASFKLGKRYPGAAIDAFDLASTDVLYSMNKKERWEIPERLQERIVDYQNEELGLRVCGYEMRYNPSKPIATDTNRIHVDTLAQFSGTFHAVTVAAHEMDEEGSEKHRYRARANVLDFQQKPNPPRLNGGKRRKIHRAAELEGLLSETESEDEKDKENKTPLVTASYACVISYRGNNVLDNTIAKSNSHTQRNRVSGRSRRRVGLDDVILDLSLDTMPLDEDIDCTSDRCKEMIASLEDFAVVKCRQPKQKKNANKVAKTSELEDKPRRLVYIPSENPAKTDLSVNYRASLTQYVLEHPRRISGILRKGVTFSIPPVLPPRLIVRDNFGKIDRRLHNFEGVLQIPFKDIDERLPTVYMQRPSASWNGMILSNKQLRDLAIDMATTSKDIETTECSICGEEVKDGFALSECSHFFCMRCWQMHAVISLRSCVAPISCMDTSCKAFVCRETLALFLSPAGLDRYDELVKLQAERAAYKGLQCLCKRVLKAELAVSGHVECKCGVHTCVRCHKVHFPMSCAEHVVYQRSLRKLGIGAPSEHPHLSLELVVCPRCALPLDRSYGCNHIVCLCGKEFCFVCGGGWSGTHYHCTQKNRKTFIMIDIPRHMREAPRRALITALNFREATTNADKTVWRSRHLDAQGRQMYRVHMRKVRRIFEFSYALLYVRVVNDQRVTGLEYWLQRAAFDYEMLQHHVEVATSSTRKLAVREAIVESNESLKTLAEFCSRLRPLVV